MMSRRRIIAVSLAVAYVVVLALAPVLDNLVLFPSTVSLPAGAAVRRTIPFDAGELEVWTASSQAARSGEAKTYVMRPARLRRVAPAATAAFDELKRRAGERPIYVYGASLGTTAALHLGATRPIAGLILHNPPALRQMILRQFGWWNLWLLAGPLSQKVPRALDSITNAKASHAPAIFLLAEKDEVVAPRFQSLVVHAYGGEKRLIHLRGARHNSPLDAESSESFHEALAWLMP